MQMSYWRFAAMIAASTLVMFGLMYVHTYVWDHAYFSETRAWMALFMGAMMAIVMLSFMRGMYKSRSINLAIFTAATAALVLTAWLIRSQATVTGTDYMEAMIPHHSIAILTSERSGIEDARVRKLADEIIEAQRKEIAEMKYLIRAQARGEVQSASRQQQPHHELAAGEAIRRANLATVDLESLTDAEVSRILGSRPACRFSYAAGGAAVAAATAPGGDGGRGVIKVNGVLIPMTVQTASADEGIELVSDDVRFLARPYDGAGERADGMFRVGTELEAGYSGFFACAP